MKRIRIGNDIRVQTSLHDLNDFDITSIKQLRCYFIPQGDSYTTPTTDTYDPMQYTICNCGKPKYNVFPCNIDAPHWFCGYNGFGVNSKRFIHVDTKFLAPSRLLEEQNRIEAYFPAKAQHQIGEYKFVIVLTIYQPGWCENNLRTITLDQGIIFALTNDDKDPDHDTTIDLDITYAESIDVPDLLYIYKTLDLGETDQKLTNYNVNIRYSDESLRKLTKDEFNEYIRTTVVNNIGNIRVKNNGQIVNDDIYSQVDANITYSLRKSYDEDPITKTIRVLSDGRMYRINYNCPSGYKINSNSENQIYITDDGQNQKLPLFHFTISKQPGVNPSFLPQITSVTATNCTLKYDESNKMYNVYAPVTGDIDINVNVSEDYMDTCLIDYTTVTDLRVEGDNEINPMHSEMQLDKQFGSFTVFDKRPTKNLDDIIITADGCIVKEISRNSESIKYGINGPITANYGEINISCTLKETPKPASKEYTIQYNYDNTQYTVTGPSKITVLNSDLQTDKMVGNFNIVCLGENNINNTQVTSTGCVIKTVGAQQSPKLINGGLYCPITATGDVITINISATPVDPKPVDKEYTYTINYYYNDEQCTIEGPSEIKVLDSKRFLNEKIGSFYVTCIGENPDSSNIQVKVTGCSVQNSAGDETSCRYDLYGPITTNNGIIKVNISINSDVPDQPHVTSISVPDEFKLESELQINIGNLDYDDVPYTITLNYSDGSNKSVTASEFNNLLNTSIDGNSGISIDESGQITRTDKFKDINTEITYQLKGNASIEATMHVVSVGKWHTIEYNHLNVIEVNGPEDLFVNNDYLDYPYSGIHLASFTARTAPGVSSTVMVERVTGDGCTIEKSTQDSYTFYICPSITKDNITINITNSSGFEEPDVDEEHTYTIQYTYDNTQYTVNGPSEVKILNSELSTDKLIGSLNITCIGENTSVDNIQVTATGCNVKSIATQETIHTYKLCGPITATGNIINVNITTKQNLRVTSIVVPDSITLQHTSHLNIGDLGYDGTAYNIRINYNDGSYKLVNADEFGELITVVINDTNNIVIGETGQIRRLNMFENVDEQVTYQLKENSSIKDTMRIVSSGKMYTINYNYDSNYVTVNGKTAVYVDDTTKIGDALPVTTFTVIPTNNEYTMTSLDMEITGASLINKPDPNTSVTRAEVTIVTPVTSDEIAITITASQFRP